MKKILTSALLLTASVTPSVFAQIPVSRVEQYTPTDMVFLDMATDAAKENKSRGQNPSGAVIVINGEFRSSGRATGSVSAEEIAFKKSRLSSLKGATIYTVNEPTTAVYKFLCDNNIGAGLATAADYNDASLPADMTKVPMFQIEFPDAGLLLK